MKNIKQLLTLVTSSVVFWPQGAWARAQANLQEGSFNWLAEDELKISGESLHLQRTYSSRSTYQGIFGLGWCSQLEWRLIKDSQNWILKKCDEFTPLPATLVRKYQKFRSIKSNQGVHLLFDDDGSLIAYQEKRKLWKISYDKEHRPQEMTSPQEIPIPLKYDTKTRFLKSFQQHQSAPSPFRYQDNLLVSSPTENYTYDNLSNLEKVTGQGQTLARMQYDKIKDLIVCIEELHQCTTRYEYRTQDMKNRLIDVVRATKSCPNKKIQSDVTQFEYRKSNSHEVQLERTSSSTEKE